MHGYSARRNAFRFVRIHRPRQRGASGNASVYGHTRSGTPLNNAAASRIHADDVLSAVFSQHKACHDDLAGRLRAYDAVDAGGTDEKGVTRVLGGNPETGPFYVETAMPGDTLAVHLTRLRLNRDWAIQRRRHR